MLAADPGVRAVFLGGSHGRGRADAFSDVDLIAVAEPADHPDLIEVWDRALGRDLTVVHRMERIGAASLVNVVCDDWLRLDLSLRADLRGRARELMVPLRDPSDLWSALPMSLPEAAPDRARVEGIVREFLRVLGLLPVGAGRGEDVVLLTGLGHLRDLTIRLMLEDCPEADRGGALHLSRLLPPDRMAVLASLPTPPCERGALVAAHLRHAGVFLPLARGLAARVGGDWPTAFEAATRRRLRDALGMELPRAQ